MLPFDARTDRKDLTGFTFGKLAVVRAGPDRKGQTTWLCKCECGKHITVRTWQLTSSKTEGKHKRTESCGCARSLPRLSGDEASFRNLYSEYKMGARRRGFTFELTSDQFRQLTSSDCHYCGAKPGKLARTSNRLGVHYVYNGIDRMNNEVGYIEVNCAPCCFICNRMKFQLSADGFVEHANKIMNHYRSMQ